MNKPKKLTGLYAKVGEVPEVLTIDNELENIQGLIGGWIEVVNVGKDILMIVDEEGALKGRPAIFENDPGGNIIYGDVFFVSNSNGDFSSLSDAQTERIKNTFY